MMNANRMGGAWRRILSGALLAACAGGVALAAGGERKSAGGVADSAFKPVAPLHALMYAAGEHYDRINALIGDPKETERNTRIRDEAMTLAELANVSRLHNESPDYRQWAEQLRDSAVNLANVAQAGDLNKAKDLSKQMNATCMACHKKYQP
ncbi:MAG TPA: cytochrome c [Phycisphaerae bacterium]|jgi:soluble cytochrome b562